MLSGTIVREFSARVGVRRTGAMSTIEETPLQPRDSKATEDSRHTSCTERLQPLQVEDATGESASSAKVTVAPVTTNGWKKCFITVTILITYAFLNAGISVIAPFYPIVVSCISFLACMVAFYQSPGALLMCDSTRSLAMKACDIGLTACSEWKHETL